jgi:hypothetical protein
MRQKEVLYGDGGSSRGVRHKHEIETRQINR